MKEFNLEEAMAGKPVCTRDGRNARIVCFDRKSNETYKIIALFENHIDDEEAFEAFTEKGEYFEGEKSNEDLFMYSEKKEGWVNIYRFSDNYYKTGGIYGSEEEARTNADSNCIATIKIEWEE